MQLQSSQQPMQTQQTANRQRVGETISAAATAPTKAAAVVASMRVVCCWQQRVKTPLPRWSQVRRRHAAIAAVSCASKQTPRQHTNRVCGVAPTANCSSSLNVSCAATAWHTHTACCRVSLLLPQPTNLPITTGGSRSGAVDVIRVSGSSAVDIVKRVFWPQVHKKKGRHVCVCMQLSLE